MGALPSYFTRKFASTRIESDPSIESSTPLTEVMATKPKDAANEPWMSKDEFRKYSNAFRDAQEFLDKSGFILDRQRKLQSELETCHERLMRFTEEHARGQSESNVVNINSTNSPSKLEENYEQFYDHERMDAVDAIENSRLQKKRDKWTVIDDKHVACLIFEESYAVAQELRKSFLQGITLILTSAPAIGAQYHEAKKKDGEFQFSFKPDGRHLNSLGQSSENSLKVIMKETAENCDVEPMVQRTVGALYKHQEKGRFEEYTKEFFLKTKIKKYIDKCCRYTWKLVCQTPPYIVEGNFSLKSDSVFSPSTHQLCRDITPSQRTSEFINCVIWPGLFDGSTGRVVRKTELILHES